MGESGCGKSTFAKVLMGLETATDGQILLDNNDIGDIPIEERDTKRSPTFRWCSRTRLIR